MNRMNRKIKWLGIVALVLIAGCATTRSGSGKIYYSLINATIKGAKPQKHPSVEGKTINVLVGGEIVFKAVPSPNQSGVTYAWSFSKGTPISSTERKVTWTAPSEVGDVTVGLKCTKDGDVFFDEYVTVKTLKIEVEVNDTPAQNDDVVQLKCEHPSRRHEVSCRVRVLGNPDADMNVVLTNPNGCLRFSGAGDVTKNLTLPKNGTWTAFKISGEEKSSKKDNAVIQVHLDTVDGQILAEEDTTVFWFDKTKMKLKRGGNYGFLGDYYTVPGGVAVSYKSQARIRPDGLDCTAPQIKDIRVGIMQHILQNFNIAVTWDNPTITWLPGHPAGGERVTVPTTMRRAVAFAASVSVPVNDGLPGAHPLYSKDAAALMPPLGCTGAGVSTSSDTPSHSAPATFSAVVVADGTSTQVGVVTWQHRINTTRFEDFRTFCAIYNTATNEHCAMKQAKWIIDLDSVNAKQRARVWSDTDPDQNPSTGPQANGVAHTTSHAGVGTATSVFQ